MSPTTRERQAKKAAEDTYWRTENARQAAAENAFRNAQDEEDARYQALVDALNMRPRDKAAEDATRAAYQQAKDNRIAARRQLHTRDPATAARYEQAKKTAEATNRRALETSDRVFREAKEAADADLQQARDTAQLAYQQARTRALEAATPI